MESEVATDDDPGSEPSSLPMETPPPSVPSSPPSSQTVPSLSAISTPPEQSAGQSGNTTVKVGVEQVTTATAVKKPMLYPRPLLQQVLRLAGGAGYSFTMQEIIGLVQEYIQDRRLYDTLQPHIVRCGGDLLGMALGVPQFTYIQAIGLFRRNCTLTPDPCTHTELATRAASHDASPASSNIASSQAVTVSSSTVAASHHAGGDSSQTSIPSQPFPDNIPSTPESASSLSSPLNSSGGPPLSQGSPSRSQGSMSCGSPLLSRLQRAPLVPQGSPLASASQRSPLRSSVPTCGSQSPPRSPGPRVKVMARADRGSVVVREVDLGPQEGLQSTECDSSTSEAEDMNLRQRLEQWDKKLTSHCRVRGTSVSITCDEVDGSGTPWQCQISLETDGQDEETLVVECGSDSFSVEYELESSDPGEGTSGQRSQAGRSGRGHLESEVSSASSPPRTACILVCEESDIEYLADYSDSDAGSDGELEDSDKWTCTHCQVQNPPFQRNCAGCWSVRADWLPHAAQGMPCQEQCDGTDGTDGSGAVSVSQRSGTDDSAAMVVSQKSDISSALFCGNTDKAEAVCVTREDLVDPPSDGNLKEESPVTAEKNIANKPEDVTNKRKYTSSIDSSDGEGKPEVVKVSSKKFSRESVCERTSESSPDESVRDKGKQKAPPAAPRGNLSDPCVVCYSKPKTASIIHGKTGHQVCCYKCAKSLKQQRKACPICRAPIQKVVRNYYL